MALTLDRLRAQIMVGERVAALKQGLRKKHPEIEAAGLCGSSVSMALVSLGWKSTVLVVGDSMDDAGYLYHDLSRVCNPDDVMVFPSGYKRNIKYGQPDPAAQILRTETMTTLGSDHAPRFIVTYPEALAERVAAAEALQQGTKTLKRGEEIEMEAIVEWLLANGFKQEDYVYEPGHFARRGSIIDIFGYNSELPMRIDFFGNEIDSIRDFDIETQLSRNKLEEIKITSNMTADAAGRTLLEALPAVALIAARSADYVPDRIDAIAAESLSISATIADDESLDTRAMEKVVDPKVFRKQWKDARILRFTAAVRTTDVNAVNFQCSPQALYHKNFDLIADSFNKFLADGYTIYILSDSPQQQHRLTQIFKDRHDKISFTPVQGTLHEGFVDHVSRTCVFTDHQIFDRFHRYTLKSDNVRSGKMALSLKELHAIEPGDYIVHVDHGVGRFAGLLRTNVNGNMQEMIKLVYANDDIIFVSIHSLHKLAKYRGKEGVPPKINKLGSGAWNRVKERTKERLKDIARDLIKLYAARKEEKGHAFSPDTYLQHELEASFAYEDTPDQLRATQEVKADMESEKPMDRLICGDVGFGKTEVAVRAAFKAAVDGKQTAVLVPTTVLAYQHFQTFSKRLADFPVRVDYLSRARTPKQVKEILADLAAGKIDIIVGTHKLVGKNVKFKDLGLLVIDEEQKFGVSVKERLKQMKTSVDTLTMSATPIPRTLQFSLMGARDLSAITTPPANRRPIVTTVAPMDDEVIAEAINFEMSRNGQVFIINNRIEGLTELEARIKRLVPDARVAVGHGRLEPAKLEKLIVDFASHDYDVLIATTIIESGIDMPNVNTMIVAGAHNFGLSELHQLRGRVGRSSRKAFCYLLTPPGMPLSPVARRRLQAIESFSDLGAGIQIAMQDLDIRGAGNLLGAEQSGFIADLGYETYQKILREAVTELRTEEFAGVLAADISTGDAHSSDEFVADCAVESDLELLLPPDYVPRDSERVALYQELDSIERETDLAAFRARLEDRFGKVPREADELLRVPRLRWMAKRLGIEKVLLKQGKMYIYFVDESNEAYYQSPMFGRLLSYLQANPTQVQIRERQGKRSFLFNNVPTVERAVDILQTTLQMPSQP